ncbi:hypothetical protein FJY93_04525 [Candidatus Kaiserbacteria bacterium]|nr:hypothetical protein [Candidatus Kaiserbacteria bacterium]
MRNPFRFVCTAVCVVVVYLALVVALMAGLSMCVSAIYYGDMAAASVSLQTFAVAMVIAVMGWYVAQKCDDDKNPIL